MISADGKSLLWLLLLLVASLTACADICRLISATDRIYFCQLNDWRFYDYCFLLIGRFKKNSYWVLLLTKWRQEWNKRE